MKEEREIGSEECLSPGTLMALLDEELGDRERTAARSHVESCARCRALSRELGATSTAVATHLGCLDDESIAAYVDQRAGRMRGALSETDTGRIHNHIAACRLCREEVAMLTRDSAVGVGVLDSLRRVIAGGAAARRSLRTPALALVAMGAVAAAVALLWLGLRPEDRRGAAGVPDVIAAGPDEKRAEPQPREELVQAPERTVEDAGIEIAGPAEEGDATPAAGSGEARGGDEEMPQTAPPAPKTALIPESEEDAASSSRALADLRLAETRGEAAEEALAAARVAGLYHRAGEYDSAARHYLQAAAAAEKAERHELRVDSTILAGAALAELGAAKQAREHLRAALTLARRTGYTKGEENALMQLELLDLPAVEGGS